MDPLDSAGKNFFHLYNAIQDEIIIDGKYMIHFGDNKKEIFTYDQVVHAMNRDRKMARSSGSTRL